MVGKGKAEWSAMAMTADKGMEFLRCNNLVDVGLDFEYAPVLEAWNSVVNEKNKINSICNLRVKASLSRPQLRALASAVCELKQLDPPPGILALYFVELLHYIAEFLQ